MMYDERQLGPVAVKYKAGIQRFTLVGAIAWDHSACGRDNHEPL